MNVDFIIVGVMKSGTTTLANYLSLHPEIAIPEWEVDFFGDNNKYNKGYAWYENYIHTYSGTLTKTRGEKTPYSYLPYTAERIHTYNAAMKLIWIMRNPVDRAFSNYTHDLFNVDEWRSFEKCLQLENTREPLYQYLSKGRYIEQVQNYLKFFPMNQMHVVVFEDFLKDPKQELVKIAEFLGVDPNEYRNKSKAPIHSKRSRVPHSPSPLLYLHRKYFGKGGRIWNFLWRYYFDRGEKMKLRVKTRKELVDYYRAYNEQLSVLLNKDLQHWNA